MFDLYELEHCPYCQKVMDFMEKNGVKYQKHDISKPNEEVADSKCMNPPIL